MRLIGMKLLVILGKQCPDISALYGSIPASAPKNVAEIQEEVRIDKNVFLGRNEGFCPE